MDNQDNQNVDVSKDKRVFQQDIIPGAVKPRHLVVPTTPRNGDMFYSDGTNFKTLPPGTNNQVLKFTSTGPAWGAQNATGPTGATGASYPSVTSNTSSATPAPSGTDNVFELSAQVVTATFGPTTGTPINGQPLRIIITSSNAATARPLSFSSATGGYSANTPPLPSTTNTGVSSILDFVYMSTNAPAKYRLIASATAA